MAKRKIKLKVTIDRWLLVISIILTFTVIAIAIFLMIFVGNQLLKAFVPTSETEPQVQFNFEGYEEVSELLKLE